LRKGKIYLSNFLVAERAHNLLRIGALYLVICERYQVGVTEEKMCSEISLAFSGSTCYLCFKKDLLFLVVIMNKFILIDVSPVSAYDFRTHPYTTKMARDRRSTTFRVSGLPAEQANDTLEADLRSLIC
jgi:hypothetical protein